MADAGPIVVAEGIMVADDSTPGLQAFRGVDLEITPGEITALVGPNGAGKSTLVRTLLGFGKRYAGRVLIAGMPARTYRLRHGVGYLPEDPSPSPGWTVAEWVEVSALVRGLSRRCAWEGTVALLSALGLRDQSRQRVDRLSRGTTRRAALAFALAGHPSLVMLDEPLSGLDPSASQKVREVLSVLRARGATVLVTTHDARSTPGPVDRFIFLEQGRVVAQLDKLGPGPIERRQPQPRDSP